MTNLKKRKIAKANARKKSNLRAKNVSKEKRETGDDINKSKNVDGCSEETNNANYVFKTWTDLADILIANNKYIDYSIDTDRENYMLMVREFISNKSLSNNSLNSLLLIREKFEKYLEGRYKFRINKNYFVDTTKNLMDNNVPQNLRVTLGFMDILIGDLGIKVIKISL